MTKKEKAPRLHRRGQGKFAYTEKNKSDFLKTQSPWVNAPAYDPVAEVVRHSQADAARLEATAADDQWFFDENPGRSFRLACGWMLVARCSIGRMRLPVQFPALAAHDALEHDTEEKARELFDWLTWGWTAENMHPFPFGVSEEIRGARHG